jgi:hypothetical protein
MGFDFDLLGAKKVKTDSINLRQNYLNRKARDQSMQQSGDNGDMETNNYGGIGGVPI